MASQIVAMRELLIEIVIANGSGDGATKNE